jgi:hypothetical protein
MQMNKTNATPLPRFRLLGGVRRRCTRNGARFGLAKRYWRFVIRSGAA